jgi:hypothetical protein
MVGLLRRAESASAWPRSPSLIWQAALCQRPRPRIASVPTSGSHAEAEGGVRNRLGKRNCEASRLGAKPLSRAIQKPGKSVFSPLSPVGQGSRFRTLACLGRTTPKWRRSRVAISVTPVPDPAGSSVGRVFRGRVRGEPDRGCGGPVRAEGCRGREEQSRSLAQQTGPEPVATTTRGPAPGHPNTRKDATPSPKGTVRGQESRRIPKRVEEHADSQYLEARPPGADSQRQDRHRPGRAARSPVRMHRRPDRTRAERTRRAHHRVPSANSDLDDTSSLLQSRRQRTQPPTAAPAARRTEAAAGSGHDRAGAMPEPL